MLLRRRGVLILCVVVPVLSIAGSLEQGVAADDPIRIPVLCYHRFGPAVADSMTIKTSTFAAQLGWLKENGYSVVPLRALVDYLRGEAPAPPAKSVAITGDDDHRSVYTEMLPLVRRYQVPVTLFVYPSAISNASYAMTWDQLRVLVATGLFEVQSHSYWHPKFRDEKQRLAPEAYRTFLDMQLIKSRLRLEQELGGKVDLLAWPFGLFDAELEQEASTAGYVAAFSIERRPVTRAEHLMALPRFMIVAADGIAGFAAVVGGSGTGKGPTHYPQRRASG
jgi:peptidoglycan/xylan/chitin deacetylase (PgdA/CDA1 family)